MSDPELQFHETWLGMVQPSEGLVVSIPVLAHAQCMERQPPEAQRALSASATIAADGAPIVSDVARLLDLLGYPPEARPVVVHDRYDLFVPEGRQTLRPTIALRDPARGHDLALIWQIPAGLELDRAETVTGPWSYTPTAKFDRLLRHVEIPIGLLSNGRDFRLLYAPAGEASGSLTFRLADMLATGGRPIFDAFVMLLSAHRLYGVDAERSLPRLLDESRKWQANVSERLAVQVFEAATLLLRGFEDAARRDNSSLLAEAMTAGGEHVHRGILTALLRIVFLLYAEDSGLMRLESVPYRDGLSVTGLYDDLRNDAAAYPDSMANRFGGWGRLVTAFRAVFLGVTHGDLTLPARRGTLFDPHRFPFLEGWEPAGSAPITNAEDRASVRVPTVSDDTVLAVLERLVMLDGQRLSYRSLDVEQIGSVYESMLGYTVERLASDAVSVRGTRRWLAADDCLAIARSTRAKWLKDELGLSGGAVDRAAKSLAASTNAIEVIEALSPLAGKDLDGTPLIRSAGRLVIQPRRSLDTTTTHYTPRSLCRPLVARVLEPILAALGPEPSADQLLSLKICDPAMGSGAFLVEACRHLADRLLAAWRREGLPQAVIESGHGPLIAARRVIAQRCLYGVDRNADAVELAKLSLWLVTLARELPFTFVDHALRHGDSLVGLDLEQIAKFHWEIGSADADLQEELVAALSEALPIRSRIEALASANSAAAQAEKQQLLWDAEDAIARLRIIADLVLTAYFVASTRSEREALRTHYRDAVLDWLREDKELSGEVMAALARFRSEVSSFHWMIEFPEVFDLGRIDPIDTSKTLGLARMDAFAGNMPFIGGRRIATVHGERYAEWLCDAFNSTGEVDYVTYFFLRANQLLGTSGTIGFIATNSISQGDTRRVGLQRLISEGLVIYDAQTRVPWPGESNVLVAPVLLAKGASQMFAKPYRLQRESVPAINSRLRTYAERADPHSLKANAGIALVGCFLRGEGFVLSPDDAKALVQASPHEKSVIRPYLIGDDIAKDSHQRPSRFVVDFALMDLEEAKRFHRAMAIIEERVRPDRERLKTTGADAAHRRYWWRFANPRVDLRTWLSNNDACLVLPRVAKHLMIALVPCDQVFSEQVVVFTVGSMTAFACLQSRVHEIWVRLLTSTMGEGLRYSATDCFDTYPFPSGSPREVVTELENAGEQLRIARGSYLDSERIGLTVLYNRMHDPRIDDSAVVRLRGLHEALDRAVLRAYAAHDPDGAWDRIDPPPYLDDAGDMKPRERFEDAVIERLFGLNERRAMSEAQNEPKPGKWAPQITLPGIGAATSTRKRRKTSRRRA